MSIESELVERVEALTGSRINELAYKALVRAALLGMPLEARRLGGRRVFVRVGEKWRTFRVTARLSEDPPGYWVSLVLYTIDRGDLVLVEMDGSTRVYLLDLPGYLATPGELITSFEADVWHRRFEALEKRLLVRAKPGEGPDPVALLKEAMKTAGVEGVIPENVELLLLPSTRDYVISIGGIYPVWFNEMTGTLTYSKYALELVMNPRTRKLGS